MKRESPSVSPGKPARSVTEQLDSLNARTRAARNPAEVLRRTMEARIEATAKRRRQHESGAASTAKAR